MTTIRNTRLCEVRLLGHARVFASGSQVSLEPKKCKEYRVQVIVLLYTLRTYSISL